MKNSQARTQRRNSYRKAGFFKMKNGVSRFNPAMIEWYKKTMEEGNRLNEAHQKEVNDSIEEQLQTKLESLKETWYEIGYNKDEIAKLEEAFIMTVVKDKDSYRADKKAATKLRKEANKSLTGRK